MTEEETFRLLRKWPIKELLERQSEWFNEPLGPPFWSDILLQAGWTRDEWKEFEIREMMENYEE